MKKYLDLSFILLILLIGGLVDIPTRYHIGQNSVSALLTILYGIFIWALWVLNPVISQNTFKIIWPFVAFLLWGLLSFIWYTFNVPGVQSLLVLLTFIGIIVVTSLLIKRHPAYLHIIEKGFFLLVWMGAAIYGLSVARFGLESNQIISARAFALSALIGISYYVARWRTGYKRGFWLALILTGLIGASLSRTALAIGLFLFPLSQFDRKNIKKWLRFGAAMIIVGAFLLFVIYNVEPIRSRFFQGDISLQLGSITINGMGRAALWRLTFASLIESPIIGKGSGSASTLINSIYPGLSHPHNDYLRVLHDYGIVGFLLWMYGFLRLCWVSWRSWEKTQRIPGSKAYIHLAAFLALVSTGLGMITDNTIVYMYVMAPLAILVGLSQGWVWRNIVVKEPVNIIKPASNPGDQVPLADIPE